MPGPVKQCADCRPPYRDPESDHATDPRPVGERPCNWLDWMAPDDRCPHCGGPVTWFLPTPLGQAFDVMGDLP